MPQGAILTNVGLSKIASATPLDQLNVVQLAVGDGAGGYPALTPDMTGLVNEVWRGTASNPIRDPNNANVLIFEAAIPASAGPFTIREQAIFDDAGDMIAIGQTSVVEKPDPNEAVGVVATMRLHVALSNAEQVDLFYTDTTATHHNSLTNRDDKDSHPASAITGVSETRDEIIGGHVFPHEPEKIVKNGDEVPVGTTHIRVSINGSVEILKAWDELTLPATITSLPILGNGFSGYDVGTSQGVFEFVNFDTFKERREGKASGWGVSQDNADNTSQLQRASAEVEELTTSGDISFSVWDIPPITINNKGSLILTSDNGLTFNSASYSETVIVTTGGKGSKTFTVDDGSGFASGDKILMVYRDDVSDPYYISIAQNPDVYGWQTQVLTILSVTGNTIVTAEPLLFALKAAYNNTIRKIESKKTKIVGGKLVNGTSSNFHNGPADNLTMKGVEIDCADSLGMRFIRCAFLSVVDSEVKNVNGNGGLFMGYGVTASGVVDTTFGNGKNGDAMLIWFAGSNNCISQRNKFLGNDMLGSMYFGAKTWNMQSVDDEFYGGKYGALTNFGSRNLKFVRPRMMGQSLAGLFLERTQYVTVDNPRMKQDLLTSDVQTQGGLVIKDCDYSVNIINPEIETQGGRSISVFNSPTYEVIRNDIHFIGGDLRGGRFQIECPVKNLKIKDMTSEKDISSFFDYDFSENGEIVGNEVTDGKLSLRSMRYATIYDNEVDANGGSVAIELTGGTQFCMLRRNISKNADLAYSVPSAVSSRYSTAIYPDNIAINCTDFIDNGVGASVSFKPSLGIEAPRNFFLPITNSDFTTAQTVAGYRAKGNGATDETAWVRVLTNEDLV